MLLLRHIPAAPLAAHVNCFWYSRGHVPEPRRVRSLPSGCADLTFNLHENRIRMFREGADRDGLTVNGAIVHGVQSRYFVLDARREAHVIGVHFRPGGAAALLGLPAGELSNRHISLEDIWGSRAVRLREQLLEVSEPPAMFALLEREFLHRIRQSLIVHPAISFALRQFDSQAMTARIASVQQATGYSDRRFTSLFTDAVGLSPKRYSRIQRLRRVVEQIARGKRDLAEVAADNGYYDQSHLNRDFREFAGVTPGSYRPMPDRSALHAEVEGEDEGRKDGGT